MDELLNTAPCGFLVFSDDGSIIEVNQTLSDILQISIEDIKQRKLESLFTIANRIFYQTHFFPLLKLHNKAEEIFLTLKGNDTECPVIVNAVRKQNDDEYYNHCIFFPVHQRQKYEDEIIRGRKIAENALEQNEQLITIKRELALHRSDLDNKITNLLDINENLIELTDIISHDIQEPIRKIALLANKIQIDEQDILSVRSTEKLVKIQENCIRMRRLISSLEQFLMVIRETTTEPVDLNEIVGKVKQKVERSLGGSSSIIYNELPTIEGNAVLLDILLYNLISNSYNFCKPGTDPVIDIRCTLMKENSFKNTQGQYSYSDHLRIEISDNGIGFDETLKEYVFGMFKKIDPKTPGIGFGLALCRKIVENHKGSIVASSASGKGCKMTIMLPVKQ